MTQSMNLRQIMKCRDGLITILNKYHRDGLTTETNNPGQFKESRKLTDFHGIAIGE